MKSIPLGESGLSVSAIAFGGWQAGREYWPGAADADSEAAVRAAVEAGITTFDTAEAYGAGHSEALLGRALRPVRREVVLATKVSWDHLDAAAVTAACESSLRRLQTDVIDLYQVHWPAGAFGSARVPIEETMGALLRLREAGKIRAIGVSNFSADELRAALACGPVDTIQPCWSLFWRAFEVETLALCQARGVTVLAYSPLAQGLLTGRFSPGHVFAEGDNRADNRLFQRPHAERAAQALDTMRPIALRHGRPLSHVALAWLHGQAGVAAIVGARTPEQARDNALAGSLTLDPDERATLDALGAAVYAPLAEAPILWTW